MRGPVQVSALDWLNVRRSSTRCEYSELERLWGFKCHSCGEAWVMISDLAHVGQPATQRSLTGYANLSGSVTSVE